jgi:subtilisin-like proprotein convertase family protein
MSLSLLGLGSTASAQVFSNSTAAPINDSPTTVSTIQVSGGPTITNLQVVVKLRHAYDADLDIVLVHNGQYLRLSSGNGDAGHDYYPTRFSDASTTNIFDGGPPFNGTYRPEGGFLIPLGASVALPSQAAANLAAFNGQSANGTWSLWIDDTADGYTGNLEYWSIEFNGAVDPNGPSLAPASTPVSVLPVTWMDGADTTQAPMPSQIPSGTGALQRLVGTLAAGGTDVYQIEICDPAHFTASTVGGTYLDTCLYLFDANGRGVSFNDEDPVNGDNSQSRLSSAFVPRAGRYMLAVTAHGRTPLDTLGRPIWMAEPATTERAADGPGAAGAVASWSGNPAGGDYRILLTGACYVGCGTTDFNGDGDYGTDADITAFFACLAGDCCPTCQSADFNGDGDIGTDADIEAFFRVLAGGAC